MKNHGSAYPLIRKLSSLNDGEINIISKPDEMKMIDKSIIKSLNKAFERNCKIYNKHSSKLKYSPGQMIKRRPYHVERVFMLNVFRRL